MCYHSTIKTASAARTMTICSFAVFSNFAITIGLLRPSKDDCRHSCVALIDNASPYCFFIKFQKYRDKLPLVCSNNMYPRGRAAVSDFWAEIIVIPKVVAGAPNNQKQVIVIGFGPHRRSCFCIRSPQYVFFYVHGAKPGCAIKPHNSILGPNKGSIQGASKAVRVPSHPYTEPE